MLYLDSAYVAKCYLNDPDSERVRDLVRGPASLYSSSICIAEVSCAIHRRISEKALTKRQGSELCDVFQAHVREGIWSIVPANEPLLWELSETLKHLAAGVFIRAGDAIHLISARRAGFGEVWTNDRHMLLAARHFGLKGKSA